MLNEKSKEPITQDEQKCTLSEIEKVELIIQQDRGITWESSDIGFTYSEKALWVVPVTYLYSNHCCVTPGSCRTTYVVESYDGRHELEPKNLYHNKLVCWLAHLVDQWGRYDDKSEIESAMESIRKNLEMERSLHNG